MIRVGDLVLSACMDTFAEPVTYRPADGAPIPLRSIYDDRSAVERFEDGVPVVEMHPVLGLWVADLPPGADPGQNELIEVRGTLKRIVDVLPDGQGGLKLVLGAARAP